MSSHQITPDETHVIKAMAWDAMEAGILLTLGTYPYNDNKRGALEEVKKLMDTTLARVGDKVSKSKTWEIGMAKKFKNDLYYKCVACGTATKKEDWQQLFLEGVSAVFSKCPHCGGIFDLSIGNETPEPAYVPDPIPPSDGSATTTKPKKPAAKK